MPAANNLQIKADVPLGPLTTLGIGGNARHFVRVHDENEVAWAVALAEDMGLGLFILGGGSNVVIADSGFPGVTMQIGIVGISEKSDAHDRDVLVTAGAGEDWDAFVAFCTGRDLAGVECLSGIPGLVGGTPVQNVGAYGQEVAETIVSARCFDRREARAVTLGNADCGFAYRTSIFNTTERDRYIVLSVTFRLTRGGAPKIVYRDLIEDLAGRQPSLADVRQTVLGIRRAKSMVIDAADPNSRSAGSFFKNPIINRETLETLRSSFPSLPHFDFGEMVKVPAAWLIENAGFSKGYAMGDAGISSNHTLALINRGRASSDEIVALMTVIQTAVDAKFGLTLQPEPVFVGFS